MDEIEVINVFKQYNNKKAERMTKLPAFLFSAVSWSYLAHYWPGPNYMCKVKCKTLANG